MPFMPTRSMFANQRPKLAMGPRMGPLPLRTNVGVQARAPMLAGMRTNRMMTGARKAPTPPAMRPYRR